MTNELKSPSCDGTAGTGEPKQAGAGGTGAVANGAGLPGRSRGNCIAGFPISDDPCPECGAKPNQPCGHFDYESMFRGIEP
jgi:hypothetical protein